MSRLRVLISAFSTIFCQIKIDMSGNTFPMIFKHRELFWALEHDLESHSVWKT